MVQAKTGTVIRLRIKQKFHTGMMDVDVGLCTALSRGLILSVPSPHTINNLSPFFTPPDGVEEFSTEDLLKIDIQYNVDNGLDDKDVRKLTKQHKTIPSNAVDLIQQIQKFSNLIGEIFGTSSYIYLQNLELYEDIRQQRRLLSNHFSSLGEAFGFTILHRIHVSNQIFLQSCTQGEISSIDLDALRFSNLLREIQMGIFQISHLFQTKKRQTEEPDDDKGDHTGKKKRKKNKNNKGETVRNKNLIPDCALKFNEKFGDIFHPEVKRAYKGKLPKLGGEDVDILLYGNNIPTP
jgi:hypothetical protein